ncbi:MAG TPA: tRNA glutamyl-Q(34) synthetase GluQRS [Acidobacteriaceae bacterium]|nr:tRNA glutamyl-Q(34) synthetase GluQRS [Acidobacteriaceae bacterium]
MPSQPSSSYRGRLAPSPTGLLHLGHARTFLTAHARTRSANGTLVLRNEDFDQQRSRPEFYKAIIEDLRWLGINWDEGPDIGGPFAPYSQSRRRASYLIAFNQLRNAGFLYPCTCSRKDLALAASAPHEGGPAQFDGDDPIYPGTCRPQAQSQAQPSSSLNHLQNLPPSHSAANWRFRVSDGEVIAFHDQHYGLQQFVAGRDFGDFLVWRRDGVPSYQLACVADDAAMRITEVVRGADLLKSAARQLLLYRALKLEPPAWYHCPLVTDSAGQRLAKRHDALSIRTLRAQGRTPQDLAQPALC